MGLKPVVGDHRIVFSPDDRNLRTDLLVITVQVLLLCLIKAQQLVQA